MFALELLKLKKLNKLTVPVGNYVHCKIDKPNEAAMLRKVFYYYSKITTYCVPNALYSTTRVLATIGYIIPS